MIQDDRHPVPEVGFSEGTEATGRRSGKLEIHLILSRKIRGGTDALASQVLPRHDGSSIENVIDRLRWLTRLSARFARNDFGARRQDATVPSERGRFRWICLLADHQVQRELPRRLNQGFRPGG